MLLDNHTTEPFNAIKAKIRDRRIKIPNGSFESATIHTETSLIESYFFDKNIKNTDDETDYNILIVNDRYPIEFTLHEFDINNSVFNDKGNISNHVDPNNHIPISFIFKETINGINLDFINLHKKGNLGGGTCGCGPCPPPDSLHYFIGSKPPIFDSECSDPGVYFFFPVLLAESNKFVYVRYKDAITPEILDNYIRYSYLSSKIMVAFNKVIKFDAQLRILYTTEPIFNSPPLIS